MADVRKGDDRYSTEPPGVLENWILHCSCDTEGF